MNGKQRASPAFVDMVYEHQRILHRICSIYASSPEDGEDLAIVGRAPCSSLHDLADLGNPQSH